jgi:hypothetical protein
MYCQEREVPRPEARGSPCLWTSQRLRPIIAGLQLLIRKTGLQKGPFQHSTAGLFAFPAIFWSAAGLPPPHFKWKM